MGRVKKRRMGRDQHKEVKLVSVNWTMNLRLISLSQREVRDRLTIAKVFLRVRDLGQ